MNASAAFGTWATDWLARIPQQNGLIVADALGAREALSEAVARKRAGSVFFASVLLRAPRGALAFALAPRLLGETSDYDQRCILFDNLAAGRMVVDGHPQHEVSPLDPAAAAGLRALVELADGVVVRSFTEYRALRAILGFRATPVRLLVPEDRRVPRFTRARPSLVLVWAPQWDAAQIGAFTLAMQEMHLPLYAVCASGLLNGQRGVVVPPDQAAPLLREAAVVIDTSMTDPATAIAFARNGVALAVASTSGAVEYLDNVAVYDPWDRRSITAAVLEALGRGPASLAADPPVEPLEIEANVDRMPPASGPKISLIVRTQGEHRTLARTLASIDDQVYTGIETIVVNDGGSAVADIVAGHRVTQTIELEHSGAAAAANAGLAAATGEYCCLVDGDDALFADWSARVAHALRRSGVALVYIDAVTAVAERAQRGLLAHGYILATVPAVSADELLIKNAFWGALRVVFRREFALASGGFSDYGGAEDYEMWVRLSRAHDFVHVASPLALYTLWTDRSNLTYVAGPRFASAHEEIHARYPVENRPHLEVAREQKIAFLREHGGWPEPLVPLRIEPPIPLP